MALRDKLPTIAEIRWRSLPIIRANANDPVKDRDGASSDVFASDLRFLGIADFILRRDIESFRHKLRDAALVRINHFVRRENGEPIAGSLLTMLCYKEVFDALAAGDEEVAKGLAVYMGGRNELEKLHDHPFDRAMGYAVKWLVLRQENEARQGIQQLAAACDKSHGRDFAGYVDLFRAVLTRDVYAANAGLAKVVQGHKRQSKGQGALRGTLDELLCVWGIGAANLARFNGVDIDGIPPLIPGELLI